MAESQSQPVNVLLVGHCRPDAYLLKHAVERALPSATVQWVNDDASLATAAEAAHVVLVNRVLDGSFEASNGHDIIRTLVSSTPRRLSVLLVSNLADAQAQAEALGAHPGIGKADANSEQSHARLREAAAKALRHRSAN